MCPDTAVQLCRCMLSGKCAIDISHLHINLSPALLDSCLSSSAASRLPLAISSSVLHPVTPTRFLPVI